MLGIRQNKLAIITTVYNRKNLLRRLSKHIVSLDTSNFLTEWIIVDDGSNDEPFSDMGWPSNVEVKLFKKINGGKHTAINLALDNINSEYLIILDSDDYITPSQFERIKYIISELKDIYDGALAYNIIKGGDKIGSLLPGKASKEYIFKIKGDVARIFKTRNIKGIKFPVFDNEKFVTEMYFWAIIHDKLDFFVFPDDVVTVEYQLDGMSSNYEYLCKNNKNGILSVIGLLLNSNYHFWDIWRFCVFHGSLLDKAYFHVRRIKAPILKKYIVIIMIFLFTSFKKLKSSMLDYIKILISTSFYTVLSNAISKICTAVAFILITRNMAAKDFGEFSIVQSNLNLLGVFMGFGLGSTAVKLISGSKNNTEKVNYTNKILMVFSLISIVVIFFSALFSKNLTAMFMLDVNKNKYFIISLPLLFFIAFSSLSSSIAIALNKIHTNSNISLIQGVVFLIIVLLAPYRNAVDIIIIMTISYAIPSLLYIIMLIKVNLESKKHLEFSEDVGFSSIFKLCIPITLSGLLIAPTTWFVTLMLSKQSGVEAVGLFNAAGQWRNIILFVPMVISPISLSFLSRIDNNISIGRRLILNSSFITSFSILVFIFLYGLSDVIEGFYTHPYKGVSQLIIIYSAATVLAVFNNVFGQYFISSGLVRFGFIFNLVWAIAYVGLSYLFISNSVIGIVYAFLLSYIIHTFVQVTFVFILFYKKNKILKYNIG